MIEFGPIEVDGSAELQRMAEIANGEARTTELLDELKELSGAVPREDKEQARWLVEGFIAEMGA